MRAVETRRNRALPAPSLDLDPLPRSAAGRVRLDLSRALTHIPGVVRAAPLVAMAALGSAVAVSGAACSEQFPSLPEAAADAGVDAPSGPLETSPPAVIPQAKRVNASSSPVVFDALRGGVWTANGDVGTISYVDPDRRTLVQEIAVGQDVRSVALSPDAAWIAAVDRAGGRVALVDAEGRVVRRTLAVGSHPRACVWDAADPRWLYVAVEDDGAVAVIDRSLGQVATTIPVARLPSGLAVSASAAELYVTHRIDGAVTVVDLSKRAVVVDVPLADEPFSDVRTPNGRPFAFEGLTLTADGQHAWIPHELLAPTHPFVFNETIFPAVSVVDVVARVEVETDPNAPGTSGRKNLFDAIDLIGNDGQPMVFSQLCGVAMHPDGYVAWALACASEDLLVFDVSQGIAVDVVRALPVDHPVGLSLDDTGQRIFVLADQSHDLVTLDTAGGNILGHTRLYGDPIPVVAKDPVDPLLRAGLTLFFRANVAKGPLATTNDDWMSCGGCHLDGFGSGNMGLFDSLTPADPSHDAQLGHDGLKDHFSTATSPTGTTFEPHDLLVALADQGGLTPVGGDGGAPVSPDTPTPEAVQMAQSLAAVVARDLPAQPTWASQAGSPPVVAWDAEFCAGCHPNEYTAWKASVHAHAGADPMMLYCARVEAQAVGGVSPDAGLGTVPFDRLCVGCHDPVGARTGDFTFATGRGVTCIGCHDVEEPIGAGGNGDLRAASHDWTVDHKAWALASLEKLRQPSFCGGCHQQFVPGTGLVAIGTRSEYEAGPFAGQTLCVDCHMPKKNGVADHRAAGGNVYMGQAIGDATLLAEQMAHVRGVLSVDAQQVSGGVLVTLRNVGAGHDFPTGVTDIRQPWVQIDARDGQGHVVASFGGLEGGLLPDGAARLGIDIAQADGTRLLEHQLSLATRIPFDVRVPSGEAQALYVAVPAPPAGTTLEAVVNFGVVRATYFRAASSDPNATMPSIELARVPVQ
jgi:DNA-binding beta-propeller fold protein YncE